MIEIKNNLCDFCGTCVSVCPTDAIELFEASLKIDQNLCTNCNRCVIVCPFSVLEAKP